jgi:GntR family transcriptional regulator
VPVADDVDAFFAQPVSVPVGQPLRVAIYSRIAEGIRSHVFPLGSALPKESELGVSLGVSRTVVREALMLLEEDGLIRTRRGVGRFVATSLPTVGLEQLRPFEQVLATPEQPVLVERLEVTLQRASDYVVQGLKLDPEANAWFWESRLIRYGEPIALVQEHIPAGRYLSDLNPALSTVAQAGRPGENGPTLLAALIDLLGPVLGPGQCEITAGVAGPTRAKHLGLAATAPLLVLTQTIQYAGKAIYLAKYLTNPATGHLSVIQSPQS